MSNPIRSMFQRMLAPAAPSEADAADLGTCFGLECSLAIPESDTPIPAANAPRRWVPGLDLFGRPAG